MWSNSQFPGDLVTFTEEILNGKLHFLCSVSLSCLRFDRYVSEILTLFRIGLLGAAHEWEDLKAPAPFPSHRICYTYPTKMKPGTSIPYRKKIQKNIWTEWYTKSSTVTSIQNFSYIRKNRQKLFLYFLIPLTFMKPLNIFLINMIAILMMSKKIVTPSLLKIKVFWNKDYDVIISDYDVISKILSHYSDSIVDLFMWPKFGNSSISIREVIMITILYNFDQRNPFFRGALGSSSIIWERH